MTNEELFTGTALATWKLMIGRLDRMISGLTDEQMQAEVAPGRNRIYYLVGHLAVVHDRMFPLLGLGEVLYPQLDEQFLAKPDRSVPDTLSGAELRKALADVNAKLTAAMEALPASDWLKKHASVSEEDFAKEPFRNRLSVLLTRTGHVTFHAGQIRLTQ